MRDHLWRWLHRRGIARCVNSGSSNTRPDVDQLMESRLWVPRWLVVWAARRNFLHMYASRAGQLRLAEVRRHPVAADGTCRWRIHWRPTH